ncbi:uncharacterized protein LOC107421335 [Ziziphus jujuba]|uniref:Uncharacterized protein LOC107421335 n=1 Tax=Ziziphus jujuba TaxID=326968 RepID=A0A6P3ZZ67_ZIZJJ|nr:uncharacterized protein LOC107421335 [Ziziphus jujuba]
MEEIRSSESPPETHSPGTGAANPAVGSSKKGETSMASRMKKDCLAFLVSVQEGFEYVKAFFVGQAKKMTAKSEEEAARADLQASKMQAEAADAAEDVKTRLSKSA